MAQANVFVLFTLVLCCNLGSALANGPPTGIKEEWFTQYLDHFNFRHTSTFKQRYFVYDSYWNKKGPVFFYPGNEASVTLFVNHTGLIWENAQSFNALVIFAEHRFFGKSMPPNWKANLDYLSVEQAMADFSVLLTDVLKAQFNTTPADTPVIAFGGSYGGMLAAWMRMKYPNIIRGSIAASAPILLPDGDGVNPEMFYRIVTQDATPQVGGASAKCVPNVRNAFKELFKQGKTAMGRSQLSKLFNLCTPLQTTSDVLALATWLQGGIATIGQADYPYPCSYFANGVALLPAWPMRVACDFMTQEANLLIGLRNAAGVLYNVTHNQKCYNWKGSSGPGQIDGYLWGYIQCTEVVAPFSTNGVQDMFWNQPWNLTATQEACKQTYGVVGRPNWAHVQFGGVGSVKQMLSNVVFSNGQLDPWRAGGIDFSVPERNVTALVIEQSAHHMDLMFSNPKDPPSVVKARQFELGQIRRWVKR